jgi:TolA-binding protein
LAEKQKAAYPDSAEASFILAVALTRTSRVEEALKEVQHARRLAEAKGGPVYFDKMIAAYEKMLTAYPDDNRVRYGLAWAYYMKAYLLAQQSRRVVRWKQANPELAAQLEAQKNPPAAATTSGVNKEVVKALTGSPAAAAATLATLATGGMTGKRGSLDNLPHIPGALEKVDPADVPQIRNYFERALGKIDEILKREPNDVWTIVYGAHLRAEYTGNLDDAMKTWKSVASKYPNNPAPYFFLGEGYLKQGNLKESINNVSRAIALRALGN